MASEADDILSIDGLTKNTWFLDKYLSVYHVSILSKFMLISD